MTVTPDLYAGSRLDRKNIPPPISIPNYSQLHHLQALSGIPKSAPVHPSNTDFMQFHMQHLMESSKTPSYHHHHPSAGHHLQPQFSVPGYTAATCPSTPGPLSPLDAVLSAGGGGGGEQDQGKNGSTALPRYKTELCRPFEESGSCKYGEKCQFAHGIQELRNLSRHPKYKTELCRTFHTIGFCPYGPRCHFIHNTEEKRQPPISPGPHNSGANATLQNLPALLSLLQQTNSLSSINKFMALFSKVQMQLSSKDDILQYLNINTAMGGAVSAAQHTPPATPGGGNMFSFAPGAAPDQYILPAAAMNQGRPVPASANATSNLHSYFNFNLALKEHGGGPPHPATMIPAASVPPLFYQSHGGSPAVTPPLVTTSSHLMTSAPSLMTSAVAAPSLMTSAVAAPSLMQTTHQQQQLSPVMSGGESSPGSDKSGGSPGEMYLQYHAGYQYHRGTATAAGDQLSTEYMLPGRVIRSEQHKGGAGGNNGKRLPIFNQLSISDPVC